MVANKNTDTEGSGLNSEVKVGGQESSSSRYGFRRPKKRTFFIIIGVLLVIIIGVLVLVQVRKPGQKIYAEVGDHKIYKKDIDAIKQNDLTITDRQAATVLADKYLTESMAKQYHVTISQADIDALNVANTPKSNKYGYQNLVNQVYFSELNINNQGTYKGKLLIANFSRNIPFQSGLLAQQKATNPNIGNPAAMAADKKYALDFITSLYDQIKSKKITFDQAMQIERNDPTVGEKAYPSLYQSQAFDGTLSQIGPLAAGSITSKVVNIKPGQLTPPFVVRAQNSAYDLKSTTESYYLVVQLDSKSGGNGNMTFQQELDQSKKQLGYKINV